MSYTMFCDCPAGVSGDMFLAAMINMGVSLGVLEEMLRTLPIGDFEISSESCSVSGIRTNRFHVGWNDKNQVRRHLGDIVKIIRESGISNTAKERSEAVFRKLAEAEASVHGSTVDKVHFHEVGAVDSIVDIVGAVLGMEVLGVDELLFPTLQLGSGYVNCQHGRIPVPVPAVLELLKGYAVTMNTGVGEKVTPTGAVLLTTLGRQVSGDFNFVAEKTGYGAGTAKRETPNVLRLIYGRSVPAEQSGEGELLLLETDIDDMSPQWLGRLMDILFARKALDVVFIPVYMKKNRPGVRVNVLCRKNDKSELMDVLFKESTTLGVRYSRVSRRCLEREIISVETPWGKVRVKKAYLRGKLVQEQAEYEDMKKIAEENNVSIKELYQTVAVSLREGGAKL